MKSFTTLFIAVLIATNSFTQTSADSTRKNALGLEVTYLLGQFLGGQFDYYGYYPLNGPYIVSYERYFNDCFLRAGLSFVYTSNNMNGNYTYSGNYEDERISTTYRIGIGHENSITKRWKWAYGFDLIGFNENYNSVYYKGEDYEYSNDTKTFTYGGGPFIKLSCDLFKNFSLGTESTLYYKQGRSKNNVDYNNYPQQDYNNSNFYRSVNINYPISVWASFKF